MMAQWWY